jgi:hypothetical protein
MHRIAVRNFLLVLVVGVGVSACSNKNTKLTYAPSAQFLKLKHETFMDGNWKADLQAFVPTDSKIKLNKDEQIEFDFIRRKFFVVLPMHDARLVGTWKSKNQSIEATLLTASKDTSVSVGDLTPTQVEAIRASITGDFLVKSVDEDHGMLTRGDKTLRLVRVQD